MSAAEQPAVSRGLLIALGAVVGVAVLAALWFFVVSPLLVDEPLAEPAPVADGDDDADELPVEPDVDLDPEADIPPPETEEVFSARDPFQQLVQASASAPADTGGTTDGTTDGGGADGGGDDGGDDGDDDPAPAVRVGQTSVRLIDVVVGGDGVTRVQVDVNGQPYEAAEDQHFAERFQVLDISGDCATFLFGDSRFTLCKGESIRK